MLQWRSEVDVGGRTETPAGPLHVRAAVHLGWLAEMVNRPAAHVVHSILLLSLVPAAQLVHTVSVVSVPGVSVPSALLHPCHVAHEAALVPALNVPGPHGAHTRITVAFSALATYDPGWHSGEASHVSVAAT